MTKTQFIANVYPDTTDSEREVLSKYVVTREKNQYLRPDIAIETGRGKMELKEVLDSLRLDLKPDYILS